VSSRLGWSLLSHSFRWSSQVFKILFRTMLWILNPPLHPRVDTWSLLIPTTLPSPERKLSPSLCFLQLMSRNLARFITYMHSLLHYLHLNVVVFFYCRFKAFCKYNVFLTSVVFMSGLLIINWCLHIFTSIFEWVITILTLYRFKKLFWPNFVRFESKCEAPNA